MITNGFCRLLGRTYAAIRATTPKTVWATFSALSKYQVEPKMLEAASGPIGPVQPRIPTSVKTIPPRIKNCFGFIREIGSAIDLYVQSIAQLASDCKRR